MNNLKIALCCLLALLGSGCATQPRQSGGEVSYTSVCEDKRAVLDTPAYVDQLWQMFARHHQSGPRSIAVFIDGTRNSSKSKTNIWLMYEMAVRQACSEPVVPFYHSGVGTSFGSLLLGALTGKGMDHLIRSSYQFVANAYRPDDEIFIFGFSRGAYAARSLNGLIEFAGLPLVVNEQSPRSLAADIKALYDAYSTQNDGRPGWERRLRSSIGKSALARQIPLHKEKVCVEAIGLFDTVPALGLGRDDFPDNHRTDLYARKGVHALSLDEQRNDFRPLRFDDRVKSTGPLTCVGCDTACGPDKELLEVWFAGAHADIGGGYLDTEGLGLSDVTKAWMLENFKETNLFGPNSDCLAGANQSDARCEAGALHDEFLANELFHHVGIHRRRPSREDVLHGSLVCRIQVPQLPEPHEREPGGVYRPQNLYFYGDDKDKIRDNLDLMYTITDYACTY